MIHLSTQSPRIRITGADRDTVVFAARIAFTMMGFAIIASIGAFA